MGRFLVMLALAVQVLGSAGLCAVADTACRGACIGDATGTECGPLSACGGRPTTLCEGAVLVCAAPSVPNDASNPPCERCEPCPLDEPFHAPTGSAHELAAAALLSAPTRPAAPCPVVRPATAPLHKAALDPGRLRPSICVWVI